LIIGIQGHPVVTGDTRYRFQSAGGWTYLLAPSLGAVRAPRVNDKRIARSSNDPTNQGVISKSRDTPGHMS